MQPVALQTMVSGPVAFSTWRMTRAAPHPWQPRLPSAKNSCGGRSRGRKRSPGVSVILLPHSDHLVFFPGAAREHVLGIIDYRLEVLDRDVAPAEARDVAGDDGLFGKRVKLSLIHISEPTRL